MAQNKNFDLSLLEYFGLKYEVIVNLGTDVIEKVKNAINNGAAHWFSERIPGGKVQVRLGVGPWREND